MTVLGNIIQNKYKKDNQMNTTTKTLKKPFLISLTFKVVIYQVGAVDQNRNNMRPDNNGCMVKPYQGVEKR